MKLMIIAATLALNPQVLADDSHYAAQLAACELVIALDNVAEEAEELADVAKRRKRVAEAQALAHLGVDADRLAEHVDRLILSPLERGATFAYAKAQFGRLEQEFDDLLGQAETLRKRTRDLDAELELVVTFRQDLGEIFSQSIRGRGPRDDAVSH